VDDWLTTGSDIADTVEQVVDAMGGSEPGLLTLYYGGSQREKDARAIVERVRAAFGRLDVEYYFGGQPSSEYLISRER
jgi:dihydroxyacetone kinase-like predicted kinase